MIFTQKPDFGDKQEFDRKFFKLQLKFHPSSNSNGNILNFDYFGKKLPTS